MGYPGALSFNLSLVLYASFSIPLCAFLLFWLSNVDGLLLLPSSFTRTLSRSGMTLQPQQPLFHAFPTSLFSTKRPPGPEQVNSMSSSRTGVTPNTSRRRMGPPVRKSQVSEQNEFVGRISVYCVASAIDLQALRAHVFRRGFGSQRVVVASPAAMTTADSAASIDPAESSTSNTELASGNMLITQTISSETDIDDEVLHVSNDPMMMNYNLLEALEEMEGLEVLDEATQQVEPGATGDDSVGTSVDANSDSSMKNIMNNRRRKQLLLMAHQDIFYFDYGCVVFWGLTPREERAALTELAAFTVDPVSKVELDDSFDTMEYILAPKANAQKPIRFDRIKLRTFKIEEKLAHSYAMAQSSKLFVFESRVLRSVEMTRYLPRELAAGGRIKSSKKELNRLIGNLFVEQTEVNLFSSILDTPDFLWDDDEHLPAYQYIRSYLEVNDRVNLLNSRLGVIRELLDVLNAQIADNNSERLEWIVIWLITIEVIMGIASNPLFAGKRVMSALLVPTAIVLFKKINWSGFL